jgi:hypothetical protein
MDPDLFRPRPFRPLPVLVAVLAALGSTLGLVDGRAAKAEMRELKREMTLAAGGFAGSKRDKDLDPKGNKPRADDPATRSLAKLREHLEVTDDAEWEIIAARIRKVGEVRGSFGKLGAGSRGGPVFSEKVKPVGRAGISAHPEQDALRSAVKDKLPDAEVKARLDRAHEVFQQNAARLDQAEADLRAVLTVRQEAVAVLAGLLPP